jgi:hypothetical protein
VEQIIRTGVVGIHCTMEFYGKDNPDNPKVYRTLALKMPPGAAGVALQGAMGPLLTGYINDFADMVKPWLERGGQTTREWAASETYRGKVEADIAALTPG